MEEIKLSEIIQNLKQSTIPNLPVIDITQQNDQSALITLPEMGGLQVLLTLSGSQLMVSADICQSSSITDRADFNEQALRMGVILPLASVGIISVDGKDHYVVYGQMYSGSKIESIVAEINAVADAALQMAEFASDFICY